MEFYPGRRGLLVCFFFFSVGLLLLAGWRKDEYRIKIISGKILYQNFLRNMFCMYYDIMTPMLYVAEHTQKILSFTI